jgi:hypothetical protein
MWSAGFLVAVLQNDPKYRALPPDQQRELCKHVTQCFSPGGNAVYMQVTFESQIISFFAGKIKQLLRTSPTVHARIASTAAAEWKAVEDALRPYVQNGLSPPTLQEDEVITIVEEQDAAGNTVWRVDKLSS